MAEIGAIIISIIIFGGLTGSFFTYLRRRRQRLNDITIYGNTAGDIIAREETTRVETTQAETVREDWKWPELHGEAVQELGTERGPAELPGPLRPAVELPAGFSHDVSFTGNNPFSSSGDYHHRTVN
jgi:hypothetical protein